MTWRLVLTALDDKRCSVVRLRPCVDKLKWFSESNYSSYKKRRIAWSRLSKNNSLISARKKLFV